MFDTFFSYPVHLLLSHGYSALFVWSVMEGEIGLMLAGWLAYEGRVFTYEHIIPVAIAGAFLGDTLVFAFGRLFKRKAMLWIKAHPQKGRQATNWLRRWGPVVIVFERFVYGTHIPVLMTIGMSGYRWWKFLLFDIVGIVLWAWTFVTLGYLFGENIIALVIYLQKNLLIFLFAMLFVYIVYHYLSRRNVS